LRCTRCGYNERERERERESKCRSIYRFMSTAQATSLMKLPLLGNDF